MGREGRNVNAIAPASSAPISTRPSSTARREGRTLKARTPLKRFGDAYELQGGCVVLFYDSASFVNGEVRRWTAASWPAGSTASERERYSHMALSIRDLTVRDIRFPTSRQPTARTR